MEVKRGRSGVEEEPTNKRKTLNGRNIVLEEVPTDNITHRHEPRLESTSHVGS